MPSLPGGSPSSARSHCTEAGQWAPGTLPPPPPAPPWARPPPLPPLPPTPAHALPPPSGGILEHRACRRAARPPGRQLVLRGSARCSTQGGPWERSSWSPAGPALQGTGRRPAASRPLLLVTRYHHWQFSTNTKGDAPRSRETSDFCGQSLCGFASSPSVCSAAWPGSRQPSYTIPPSQSPSQGSVPPPPSLQPHPPPAIPAPGGSGHGLGRLRSGCRAPAARFCCSWPFGQTPERPEHTGGTQAVFLARQLSLIKPQSQTQNLHDTPRNHTGAAGQL